MARLKAKNRPFAPVGNGTANTSWSRSADMRGAVSGQKSERKEVAMDTTDRNQVASSPTDRYQIHLSMAVGRLTNRLRDAAPLIKLLSMSSTPSKYRQAVGGVMGKEALTALALGLLQLASPEFWDAAHVQESMTPELMQQLEQLGVVVDSDVYPR